MSSSRPSSSRARARAAARSSTTASTASTSGLQQGSQTWSTVSEPPLADAPPAGELQTQPEKSEVSGGDIGGPVLIEGSEGCWPNFVKTVRGQGIQPGAHKSRNGKAEEGMRRRIEQETLLGRIGGQSSTAEGRWGIGMAPPTEQRTSRSYSYLAIWRTNMTEDTKTNRELYIKTTLRELVIYCIFLAVLMILSLGMTSTNMFYYTQALSGLFTATPAADTQTPFTRINSIPGWWSFAKGPLMDGLYWESWYNSDNFSDPKEKNFIYYDNKLLGVPRIRQLRVRNNSCTVADDFKDEITFCHSSFSPGVEEKRPFGYMNSSAWNYSTEKQLDGRSFSGEISSYPGSGYYVDLSRNKEDSTAQLNELFTGLWIDRGTRVVFVDFTVYNANINLFCVVKLVLELPATGGAIPSSDFRTVKLLRYVEPKDYFVLVCEGIFMLFICYYIVEEVIEIKRNKLDYFKTFWNWLDIIVILVSLICGGFNVYRTVTVGKKLQELLQDESRFPDFDFLSYWQQQFNNAIAFTLFLAWVKFFKYISFNKTMTQLSSTLSACAKDLMGFAVMFFIVFFAFAQLGYLIFGTQIKDFREFHHSVFTLFRIILGDFDFHQLESANRVLGPLFFLLYVFFVFFVLINMFLAIINDTYSEVKTDLANQPNEFEMADYFKERASKMLQKLNLKQEKILDIQSALKTADMNDDKQLDFEEWRSELKARGYADGEIEALFSKYDQDGDRVLDEREQRAMTSELEGQ
uniref:EF-hand domain-containing protein n=1 Tax=Macrostomum lignano TaxID=282301 RepID=A0A1I8IF70_9PLAT